jgi:hypothetical protein
MYVLKTDVQSYDTKRLIPKGSTLVSIYEDANRENGILAFARFAGERHRVSIKKTDMEWLNEPLAG